MAYTNKTAHFDLPQCISTDKINWYDMNTAFLKIDAAMYNNQTNATDAVATASAADAKANALQQSVNNIQNTLNKLPFQSGVVNGEYGRLYVNYQPSTSILTLALRAYYETNITALNFNYKLPDFVPNPSKDYLLVSSLSIRIRIANQDSIFISDNMYINTEKMLCYNRGSIENQAISDLYIQATVLFPPINYI